ncbi:hypothetical protein [Duncaniella muris]|uniref:hypothetical protein n=1 Tax=Duncaniella muris TaxID=2094150 RepID=UPI003F675801
MDIADITIRGTESPIFIRLADRRRPYSKDVPVENVGSISGVRLHDILIDEAGPGGSSITGVEGHPVRDIELRNITIRHKGGQKAVAAPSDEKIAEYPESTMWGILPAQGFWLNHTRGVIFDNVRIEAITPMPARSSSPQTPKASSPRSESWGDYLRLRLWRTFAGLSPFGFRKLHPLSGSRLDCQQS